MSFLGKEYAFIGQENFEAFLKHVGVPEDQMGKYLEFKPKTKIVKDGDSYTQITTTADGVRETKFQSGVEFDELIQGTYPVKSTYTVDGNTVTQVLKAKDSKWATFKKEFNGDDLIVTLTASDWDGVAKRFYKA